MPLKSLSTVCQDTAKRQNHTSALTHDEALMGHIKDSFGLCLLLDRSAVAFNPSSHLNSTANPAKCIVCRNMRSAL